MNMLVLRRSSVLAALGVMALVALSSHASLAETHPWSTISELSIPELGERLVVPSAYETAELDIDALRTFLASAPIENSQGAAEARSTSILSLPLPDGTNGRFQIVESPIMHPDLGSRYPEIRTYLGAGIDDPTAIARLSLTPKGFHGMILGSGGTIYIDPFQRNDALHYISFFKRDFVYDDSRMLPEVGPLGQDGEGAREVRRLMAEGAYESVVGGPVTKRTYRLAVGATGEYTNFHGGTVAAGLAAIVVAMNRINGVYERDLAIRMELVANNDLIVYTNPATDPYTNNNGGVMLGQNQSTCDGVIGSANYDIGHVFSTGGGGVARLAVVCRNGLKAQGVTGLPSPIGDTFYIDFVAHEMGHQWGGNHSFNGSAGNCSGGNRNPGTAYEPGSGSTIMAYAGICGAHNLQPHSDDYFHVISLQEIISYSRSGSGNGCAATSSDGNTDPVVGVVETGLTLPIDTPFALTATGSDAEDAGLTYCWEEFDLGPAGAPWAPVGNAPIFRSFDPVPSPVRLFPQLSDILANTQSQGEILPSYARSLNFRCTLRDNHAGAGGVDWVQNSFTVTASAGPFEITSHNFPGNVWGVGSSQTITWDVANTTGAGVNTPTVDITLSTDAGQDEFPFVLATGVPNSGSATIVVPATPTTQARVKVKGAGHIFFDINNRNIEITGAAGIADPGGVGAVRTALFANKPNPFNPSTTIAFELAESGAVSLRVYDLAGRLVQTLADRPFAAGQHALDWDGRDAGGSPVASGVYLYQLETGSETQTRRMVLLK